MFEELQQLSLKRALELMKLELDPDDPAHKNLFQRQQQIIQSVLGVGARVDQAGLRPKSEDKMAQLLADLRATRTAQ